jgi:hypothetical protein
MQVWRDASAQLQEEAAGACCSIIPQVMEEGDGVAAVAQLQPRPALVQMMTQVLQLAHAAAAAGTAPFSRSPPIIQSESAGFFGRNCITRRRVRARDWAADSGRGAWPVEILTFICHILEHQSWL